MINREELKIGECYWVAAPNLYDHTTYEVDKFELVSVEGNNNRCMCDFTRLKNWKANKDMLRMRRGDKVHFDNIYVFETQKEAFRYAVEQNWRISRHASRMAIKYEK